MEGKTLIAKGVGMSEAYTLGEENVLDRRCDIILDGDEIVNFVKDRFRRKPGGKK